MSKKYIVNAEALTSAEIWREATKEELRVLACILAKGGEVASEKALAEDCGISTSRARSSVKMWIDEGVMTEDASKLPSGNITYEFPERQERGAVDNERSVDVAKEIRDAELREVIEDIAELIGKPSLNTQETKYVTALYSQLGLGREYILTLASFISARKRITAKSLLDQAERLVEKNIDNVELLEKYIEDVTSTSALEHEIRSMFGIYNRQLSKTEKEHIKRWNEEFSYGIDIIGEAFDIMVGSINKVSFAYINKILTVWHENGVTTVEGAREYREKAEMAKSERRTSKAPRKKSAEVAEYADFSSDDALMRALERSYGDSK